MHERNSFETRLIAALHAYADTAPDDLDAAAVTARAAGGPGRHTPWRTGWGRRAFVAVFAALVVLSLVVGAVFVGSMLPARDNRNAVVASGSPAPSPQLPAPSPQLLVAPPAVLSSPSNASAPCAPMLQFLQNQWSPDSPSSSVPQGVPAHTTGSADVVVDVSGPAGTTSARFDTTGDGLVPVTLQQDGNRAFPGLMGIPRPAGGRIVPSPDGRAIAIEEGDLGQAGCGDPIVLLADGGGRRPFPAAAFQLVRELAWAPDASALYAIRIRTIDERGQPYVDPSTGQASGGPATLLRWGARTGQAADLGTPCAPCRLTGLAVSPDGARLAATDSSDTLVRAPDGTWSRIVGHRFVAWVDAGSLIVTRGTGRDVWARVSPAGETIATWGDPCCDTAIEGAVSPDGTTLAGLTLSSDHLSIRLSLMDLRDGRSRVVWSAPDVRGCEVYADGTVERTRCVASRGSTATPDPVVAMSSSAQVVAWSPRGDAVVLYDPIDPDPAAGQLRVVGTDGVQVGPHVSVPAIDRSVTLGVPTGLPSVVWLRPPG